MDLAQVISGFIVGAIVGVTGVGGGSLMTLLLVLLFGVAPATAGGTDLLERYARLMRNLDAHPIRLGLYYPLVGGWREWRFRS